MKKWMYGIFIGLISWVMVLHPAEEYINHPHESCEGTPYSYITSAITLGGSNTELPQTFCVDSMGSMYVSGWTFSDDFPLLNAYDSTYESDNIFVTKMNPDTSLNFSSFFGNGHVRGIAVDDTGACYITGSTSVSSFPTFNAYNSTKGGEEDVFVSKFNPDGTLNFSTFIGGSENEGSFDIVVDGSGACYITGYTDSSDFPTHNVISSTYSGERDIFISKFNSDGTLNYSTFLGGSQYDLGGSITVDELGKCYITGLTYSSDFPLVNPMDASLEGESDTVITIINFDGTLNFSSYFGGNSEDSGSTIRIDEENSIYIKGGSTSSDLPLTYQYRGITGDWGGKPWYTFVLKLDASREIEFCTHLDRHAGDIYIMDDESVYIGGNVIDSDDFFTQYWYDSTLGGTQDCTLSNLNSDGTLNFSTYLGGDSVDSFIGMGLSVSNPGEILLCGYTKSMDLPLERIGSHGDSYPDVFVIGLYSPTLDSDSDGIVNYWEVQNNLDMSDPMDANEDPDEDGLTNFMEFLLGTDPHNADTDNDGFRDGKDVNPLSFLVPTGIIIIVVGSISGIASITFILVRITLKRKRIELRLEEIKSFLQKGRYSDALASLDSSSPSIERSRTEKYHDTWKRLYTQAERSLHYDTEFMKQKKMVGIEKDAFIYNNLIQLLKTMNTDPHINSIDKKILSDISDLIDQVSDKGNP